MIRLALLLVPFFLCITSPGLRPVLAQETGGVTIDWIFGGGAERVAATPRTLWVSDGRLMLYDTLSGGPEGVFRLLDPVTGRVSSALDMAAALESLREARQGELDVAQDDLPEKWAHFTEKNAKHFGR